MIKEDQVHFPLSTMISYNDHTSASAVPCPNLQNSQYGQGVQLSQQNHQSNGRGGSSVQLLFNSAEPAAAVDRSTREEAALPAVKWMSSKMRLMRKMMMGEDDRIIIGKQGSSSSSRRRGLQDHRAQSTNPAECSTSSSNGIIIRVCSNCSTTKTPLWRSGPQGPKSLCNACGIRQMKARRALRAAAAAAAAVNGGSVLVPAATALPPKKAPKEERSEVDRTVPFKKRFKIAAAAAAASSAQKKLPFDDITISLTKKLAFHQAAFPQEEKDAAILLMALSCGLIHG